jgi:hypothetical protein
VIGDKAQCGKRGGSDDAEPTEYLKFKVGTEREVQTNGYAAGKYCKYALAQRQPKEDGLAEIANLAVDFDFHIEFSFQGLVALEAEHLLFLDKKNAQMMPIDLSARFWQSEN